MCSKYSVIALLLVTVIAQYSDCARDRNKYVIPEPKIEVFSRGFRVSIPDQEGVRLFAFHGNVNVPLDNLEAGHYSKDIVKTENGHWVFEDSLRTLRVGDVIYYWLFVIRFNLGYRFDDGKFVVKEIIPYKPLSSNSDDSEGNTDSDAPWTFESINKVPAGLVPNCPDTLAGTQATSSSGTSTSTTGASGQQKTISTCCQLFLNSTKSTILLGEKLDRLMEENRILREIAEKDDYYATTLKLFGKYPEQHYDTPKEFVQNLLSEKLKLDKIKVVEAKKIPDNGISFKVEALKDKLQILTNRGLLAGSNYEITG